jgi:hypothetical protein
MDEIQKLRDTIDKFELIADKCPNASDSAKQIAMWLRELLSIKAASAMSMSFANDKRTMYGHMRSQIESINANNAEMQQLLRSLGY